MNGFVEAEVRKLGIDMCWIYVDTNVEECLQRMQVRGRVEERAIPKAYMQSLEDNYIHLAEERNAFIVNGNAPEDDVYGETKDLIDCIKIHQV